MKGKIYNLSNVGKARKGKATLRVNQKTGLFVISGAASKTLDLNTNDRVEILESDEEPGDFYISKTTSESGFPLREKKTVKNSTNAFNSRKLSEIVLKKFPDAKIVSFLISAAAVEVEGRNWFYIITGSAYNISK